MLPALHNDSDVSEPLYQSIFDQRSMLPALHNDVSETLYQSIFDQRSMLPALHNDSDVSETLAMLKFFRISRPITLDAITPEIYSSHTSLSGRDVNVVRRPTFTAVLGREGTFSPEPAPALLARRNRRRRFWLVRLGALAAAGRLLTRARKSREAQPLEKIFHAVPESVFRQVVLFL
jgi:hypothetical protein